MISWKRLKEVIDQKAIYPQYTEDNDSYFIRLYDSGIMIDECIISKRFNPDDQLEFETTYKSSSNGALVGLSKISGNTDNTKIGNVGDALKVTGAIFGSASAGSAPVNPPLSVSGVDGGGLKRHLLVDSSGRLITGDLGTVSPGTVASYSSLAGGQYNSSDPTLTNAQQAALQLTNSGRLKVDANISAFAGTAVQAWSKKLRYVDMTAITRQASITAASGWNTAFSYSGSGNLISFVLNLETMTEWYIRLLVDGEEIFGSAGIYVNDLTSDAIYDLDDSGKSADDGLGFSHGIFVGAHDTIHWKAPINYPIGYASSVQVLISRGAGAATKKFRAGFIVLTKET